MSTSTEHIVLAVIVSLPPSLAALAALIAALRGLHRVERLESRVDGRLSELLELTRIAAHAQGLTQGRQEGSGGSGVSLGSPPPPR